MGTNKLPIFQCQNIMVRITEELIRKKSEHNECIIGTLEELSLHQEDVEKIENVGNWCKELQILYLQANIISKIENLHKLKKLEYLNLAINNIECIENLEKCEYLTKLDLTLNFIGNLESVNSLKNNTHLKELYLTGNPCSDFDGYREYVVACLPQLKSLDQKDITISERIKAQQIFPSVEPKIKTFQEKYYVFREEQKRRLANSNLYDLDNETFWKTSTENSPETRVEIAKRTQKNKELKNNPEKAPPKKEYRCFSKNGRPLNCNQAKLDFTFDMDDPEKYLLDVAVYKHLDTNLIDVDLQPIYVKITIKGKVFQIVFAEEVITHKSTALRSQITGHLVLTMPKANYKKPLTQNKQKSLPEKKVVDKKNNYLEVEPSIDLDFSKIVDHKPTFEDNLEVPPLEYG
ncbi:unnamed protein product [Brassicogethes aeneus]|uniref:U2A'/phosphoprotein 32 family A C-terminal domain-containing protein n=1 Tax=Brassicogethes aeneus TaxID=1431903 RepID=A0A9P0F8Z1_BRAAE|nr:unnamed protein product [Brassicogethes aeneus]